MVRPLVSVPPLSYASGGTPYWNEYEPEIFVTVVFNQLRIVKFIIYGNLLQIYAKSPKIFFSFISRPILIVIALFGRAELRTLNFYTEFWHFAPFN